MIRNVLFDLGGVLIDLDIRRSLLAFDALKQPGVELLSSQVTEDGLKGGHSSELMEAYQVGAITTRQFLDALLSVCQPGTTDQQLKDAWFAMLLGIREDRKQLLRDLQSHGYNIYILSNINELHVGWTLAHCPEIKAAKGIFFSNEIHLSKPDPRCYELVLQQTGIQPEETLYIDDLLPNIEAGRQFGLQTLQAVDDGWLQEIRRELRIES